jgi:hypothetical protein
MPKIGGCKVGDGANHELNLAVSRGGVGMGHL